MTKEIVDLIYEMKMKNMNIEGINFWNDYDDKGMMNAKVSLILGLEQRYTHEEVAFYLMTFIELNKLQYEKSTWQRIGANVIFDLYFKDISAKHLIQQENEFEQVLIGIFNDKSAEIEIEQLIGKINLLLEKLHIEANGEKRKVIENELKNVYRRLVELEYF